MNKERITQIEKAIKELDRIREHLDLEDEYDFLRELNEFIFLLIHNKNSTDTAYPPIKKYNMHTFLLISGEVDDHAESFFSVKKEVIQTTSKLKKVALKRINFDFLSEKKLKASEVQWVNCSINRLEGYAKDPSTGFNFAFIFLVVEDIHKVRVNEYTRTG